MPSFIKPIQSLNKQNRLATIGALLLIKALVIALIVNFYIGAMLIQGGVEPDHFFADMVHESLVADTTDVQLDVQLETHTSSDADGDDIRACVRREGLQCSLYPCIETDGVVTATNTTVNFGYAGRFVHRDANVKKQLMHTIGDNNWGSGCVVSDEYKV